MNPKINLLAILLLATTIFSCEKDDNEPNVDMDAVIEDIHTQLVQQEMLADDDLESFRQNVSDSESLVNVITSTSYDDSSDKTTKTITVSAMSSDVRSITIFEFIPKDVAESVSEIEFGIEPTQIINDDPLIMWHLEGYDEEEWEQFLKEWSQTYVIDKKHTRTGTTVIVANNYNRKGKFESGVKTNSEMFGITYFTYEDIADWDEIVYGVFGKNFRVADWTDLEEYYEKDGDVLTLFDELGLSEYGNSVFVTRNGEKNYSGNRYYFATRHEQNKPGSYLAHENINNYQISLGSWYMELRILAIRK